MSSTYKYCNKCKTQVPMTEYRLGKGGCMECINAAARVRYHLKKSDDPRRKERQVRDSLLRERAIFRPLNLATLEGEIKELRVMVDHLYQSNLRQQEFNLALVNSNNELQERLNTLEEERLTRPCRESMSPSDNILGWK